MNQPLVFKACTLYERRMSFPPENGAVVVFDELSFGISAFKIGIRYNQSCHHFTSKKIPMGLALSRDLEEISSAKILVDAMAPEAGLETT